MNCRGLLGSIQSIVIVLIICLSSGLTQKLLENNFCEVRPTLVAVDSPSFRKFPFYVSLHRCGGSVGYVPPRTMFCGAKETETIKVKVEDAHTLEPGYVEMLNHTSCMEQCVDTKAMCDPEYQVWRKEYCGCECKYDIGPPGGCPPKFKWNKYLCKCECDSAPNALQCLREEKEWNEDKCGCSCSKRVINRCRLLNKDLDEQNCVCVTRQLTVAAQKSETDCVSKELLFGLMLGELILILVAVEICLYMKNLGLLNYLLKGVKSRKERGARASEEYDEPKSPFTNHDRTTYL